MFYCHLNRDPLFYNCQLCPQSQHTVIFLILVFSDLIIGIKIRRKTKHLTKNKNFKKTNKSDNSEIRDEIQP